MASLERSLEILTYAMNTMATTAKPKSPVYLTYKNLPLFNNMQKRQTYLVEDILNIKDIDAAFENEGYFRRIVSRYLELFWKREYTITGNKKVRVKWVENRLFELEQNSKEPLNELFKQISLDLFKYSNAILFKYRSSTKKYRVSGKKWNNGSKDINPIITVFPIPIRGLAAEIKQSSTGSKLMRYTYMMPNGVILRLPTEDTIHFKLYSAPGDVFGAPMVGPVIEDIKALRRIEENVELLVFQYAIPFFHVRVGDDNFPAETNDINIVSDDIDQMSVSGMLITGHRVQISPVSASQAAIDVQPYLKYFKDRILGTLGSSAVEMGEGATSNRSTSLTIDRITQEVAKYAQDSFEEFINKYLIRELLLEGGFKIKTPDDMVYLKFKELDLDQLIQMQSHYLNLFNNEVLNHDEVRIKMGLKPMTKQQLDKTRYFLFPTKGNIGVEGNIDGSVENTLHPENQYGKKKSKGEPQN